MQFAEFTGSAAMRRRYWARSTAGWRRMATAQANAAHRALAAMELAGYVDHVVTQNVDGLHAAAGSSRLIELHGRLRQVRCIACQAVISRADWQQELEAANPGAQTFGSPAPDGDTVLGESAWAGFQVPDCIRCGGILKPDVVFFGENVPPARVARAMAALDAADGLLVVGSSLMVFSGFRFAREAAKRGKPIAAINQGRTRADDLLDCKHEGDCGLVLPALADALGCHLPPEA